MRHFFFGKFFGDGLPLVRSGIQDGKSCGGYDDNDHEEQRSKGRGNKREAHKHTQLHTNNKLKYGVKKEWFSKKDDAIVDVGIKEKTQYY